jgi:mono/diheme cytochrome c family protein
VGRDTDNEIDAMKFSWSRAGLVLVAILGSSSTAMAGGDAAAGQRIFGSHCAVCHATEAGAKNQRS